MTANVKSNQSPLPETKLPSCWHDDVRMNSLYAPFRERNVNPLDWDSKHKFWSTLINDWCTYKSSPAFTLVDLKTAFLRDGRSPLCFPSIIETMLCNNDLCVYSDFITVPPEKTWTAWTMDLLVKKPLVWSFNKVKDSLVSTPPKDEEQYVNLIAAKSQGEALLAAVNEDSRDKLFQLDELTSIFAEKTGSIKDITIAIHWLRRTGKAVITTSTEGNCVLVKFASSTEKKAVVSEVDLVVDALKRNEKKLVQTLERLEAEKRAAEDDARTYIKKGMREVAKSSLRKKKALEKSINNRVAALDNLQMLLSRVKEAMVDGEVMEAYKMGVAALKATFKEADITEDTAADTVTDIEEVLDIHNSIQDTLSQQIGVPGDEDLEDELEMLLRTDKSSIPPPDAGSPTQPPKKTPAEQDLEQRFKELRLPNFPAPPTFDPNASGRDSAKRATEL